LSQGLDRILVYSSSPDWHQKIGGIHESVSRATYFEQGSEQDKSLREILENVRVRKDSAVQEYTRKFDGVKLSAQEFRISEGQLNRAHKDIDRGLLKLVREAIGNVRDYQSRVFVGGSDISGIKYTPVKRVGICVPGASAPLPSTVIMTAVPAQVARVEQIAVVSPPRHKDSIHPVILAVCRELGIEQVYRIGGAQAVAALAFGTETIEPVDKIVGPGNQWVQMAKKYVFGRVGIDSIAGPSEVLIIADDSAKPAWVAADMLSQAEHAPGSAVVFTDSKKLAETVLQELKQQVKELNRQKETVDCLLRFGGIFVFEDMESVIIEANHFAAEHLEIHCGQRSRVVASRIDNAGAIFIGEYTPVAVGDYWAGPSHTLPTGQTAKFFSALSANDFVKCTSIIEYDIGKLAASSEKIIRLAKAEGLDAHAKSVRIRDEKQGK